MDEPPAGADFLVDARDFVPLAVGRVEGDPVATADAHVDVGRGGGAGRAGSEQALQRFRLGPRAPDFFRPDGEAAVEGEAGFFPELFHDVCNSSC